MPILRLLLAVGLLAGTLFCAFGFLATFEPVNYAWQFRVAYCVAGAALLTGAIYSARQAWHHR